MRRKIIKSNIFIIPFVAVISIKNADASDTKVQRAGDSMSQDSTSIIPMDYIKLVPATSQTTTSTTVGAGSITNKPSCGESNNSILTSPPTSFLCVSGIASTVVTTPTTNGGENYSWTCSNTKGEVANCAATKRVVGTCGSANGSISSSAPTGNLCAPGTASPVTLNGSLYSWTCSGNYGSPASCSANYLPPSGKWQFDHYGEANNEYMSYSWCLGDKANSVNALGKTCSPQGDKCSMWTYGVPIMVCK